MCRAVNDPTEGRQAARRPRGREPRPDPATNTSPGTLEAGEFPPLGLAKAAFPCSSVCFHVFLWQKPSVR
jgi:hypothetical protein